MKNLLLTFFAAITFLVSFSQEFTLTHDSQLRSYRLHIPSDYDADSIYPLIVNLHGLGSNALEQEIYTGFNSVADSAGFLVTYPNGVSETWNVSSSTGTDDVGFVSALIDTIDLNYNIDLNRVYATGMSMGGFMCYRLACELSGRIAAIASVTGLQAFYPCNPERPVPVMQFHGTADPIVPYTGVPTTINNWVNYNVCPATPVITGLPDIDTTDNSTVNKSYYGPCDESTEVILYTINGGEHTWPGATIYIGVTNQDIKASVEIWDFFNKFTLLGSTAIPDTPENNDPFWSIYPNPVSGLATVELFFMPASHFHFRIYNLTGEIVIDINDPGSQSFFIDCSLIPAGFYLSEVTNGRSRTFQKLIIN
jgi:polyhydroxybutyrate depolymerase